MFQPLNPLLHSELRLAVVSLLSTVESATFSFLKEKTRSTSGNLSIQIKKLQEAGYVKVKKSFKNNYPQTACALTKKGLKAFDEYVEALKGYLK